MQYFFPVFVFLDILDKKFYDRDNIETLHVVKLRVF